MKRVLALLTAIAVGLVMFVGVSAPADASSGWKYCNSSKSVRGSTVGVASSLAKQDFEILYVGDCTTLSDDARLISTVSKSYRVSYGHGYGKCKKGAAWWNPSPKHHKITIRNYSTSKCKNT